LRFLFSAQGAPGGVGDQDLGLAFQGLRRGLSHHRRPSGATGDFPPECFGFVKLEISAVGGWRPFAVVCCRRARREKAGIDQLCSPRRFWIALPSRRDCLGSTLGGPRRAYSTGYLPGPVWKARLRLLYASSRPFRNWLEYLWAFFDNQHTRL